MGVIKVNIVYIFDQDFSNEELYIVFDISAGSCTSKSAYVSTIPRVGLFNVCVCVRGGGGMAKWQQKCHFVSARLQTFNYFGGRGQT